MKVVLLAIALLQQLPAAAYFPESVDALWGSTHARVLVGGTVAAVSLDEHGAVTFRIGDHHGHFVNCVYPAGQKEQPAVGVEVRVYGVRKKWTVPEKGQGVVEINPVERVEPAE